jgi:hypothetical protein
LLEALKAGLAVNDETWNYLLAKKLQDAKDKAIKERNRLGYESEEMGCWSRPESK